MGEGDGNWDGQPEPCQQPGWPIGAGGKGRYPMLTPPPPIESCLGEQGGGVAERGEGRGRRGQVELAQERAVQGKTL